MFGCSGYLVGVVVCGLSGLVFMCGGSFLGEGLYGCNVDNCVEFLVVNVVDIGYVLLKNGMGYDNMYGYGFVMFFFVEVLGMF